MADPGLAHNHLATILNALAAIDRRLCRIETSLQLPTPGHANIANPGVSGPASSSPANPAATAVQAGHLAAPPPPQALQQQQHHQNHHLHLHQQHHQPQPGPAVILTGSPVTGHTTTINNTNNNNNNNNNPAAALLSPNPLTLTALEPPPQGYTISSRATMQEELDLWTLPRGYSMRIAGAKVTGKRKVRWVCFRGGEARHHRAPVDESVLLRAKAEGRRKPTTDRASKKCGCLFKFEVIETAKDSDVWVLHYPNEEHKVHNHGPSDTTSDPRARKLPGFMSEEVDRWLREGWLVSKIQDELRRRGFVNVLNTDLYNRKRLLKKDGGEEPLEV